jgi:hypothetical protein
VRNAAAREMHIVETTGVMNAVRLPKAQREIVISAFVAWEKVRQRPEPPVEGVWIDDFLARAAVAWSVDNPDSIVWFDSLAMQERLRESLPPGRGAYVIGAGDKANVQIDSLAQAPLDRVVTVFASSNAHGTGKNLQRWSRALILCPSSSGATWTQLVGRLHRPGQEADEVTFDYCAHTPELKEAVKKAYENSQGILTTGRQKMLEGTWINSTLGEENCADTLRVTAPVS